MNPQRFAESNIVMTATPGEEDCCRDVHAFRSRDAIITCWRPTPEELVKLNLGEPVENACHPFGSGVIIRS